MVTTEGDLDECINILTLFQQLLSSLIRILAENTEIWKWNLKLERHPYTPLHLWQSIPQVSMIFWIFLFNITEQ